MIIDSHAHYVHPRFHGEFPCLAREGDDYALRRVDRERLLDEMEARGIVGAIEPSIGADRWEQQRALTEAHRGTLWSAVGVHPTRCIRTPWKKRRQLAEYAEQVSPVAIGETGLDYHYPRRQQFRLRQRRWFVLQIKLADRLGLPLILHIRDADREALRLLRRYRARLHGGVVHCFSGDAALARAYLALGLSLGIGGRLLCDDEAGRRLCETVREVPVEALLVETDAPFVLPDLPTLSCSRNQRKKLCNSSLILPAVLDRIAELRGEDRERVEEVIYRNTVRLFGIERKGVRNDG